MDSDKRDNESGQMLLLTAFILAIGFIALTSMAARIDQIPDEAELLQEDPFFSEVSFVVDGIGLAMDGLAGVESGNMTADYLADLDGAMAHLVQVESARGYYVTVSPATCGAPSATVTVDVAIASTINEVTLSVSRTYPSLACP